MDNQLKEQLKALTQSPTSARKRPTVKHYVLSLALLLVVFSLIGLFIYALVVSNAHDESVQATAIATSETVLPTNTPTLNDRLTQIVNVNGAIIHYNAATQDMTVVYNIPTLYDYDSGVSQSKLIAFTVMQNVYTSSFTAIHSVTVNVQTTFFDRYGKQSTDNFASAMLTQSSAKLFVWSNLYSGSAWEAYDSTYIFPKGNNP